jgi:uncharacterized membrane protein
MKARIDAFLNSWISKKLMVFIVASFGLFSGTLMSSEWVNVAIVYIGTQGALDIVMKLRANNNN